MNSKSSSVIVLILQRDIHHVKRDIKPVKRDVEPCQKRHEIGEWNKWTRSRVRSLCWFLQINFVWLVSTLIRVKLEFIVQNILTYMYHIYVIHIYIYIYAIYMHMYMYTFPSLLFIRVKLICWFESNEVDVDTRQDKLICLACSLYDRKKPQTLNPKLCNLNPPKRGSEREAAKEMERQKGPSDFAPGVCVREKSSTWKSEPQNKIGATTPGRFFLSYVLSFFLSFFFWCRNPN